MINEQDLNNFFKDVSLFSNSETEEKVNEFSTEYEIFNNKLEEIFKDEKKSIKLSNGFKENKEFKINVLFVNWLVLYLSSNWLDKRLSDEKTSKKILDKLYTLVCQKEMLNSSLMSKLFPEYNNVISKLENLNNNECNSLKFFELCYLSSFLNQNNEEKYLLDFKILLNYKGSLDIESIRSFNILGHDVNMIKLFTGKENIKESKISHSFLDLTSSILDLKKETLPYILNLEIIYSYMINIFNYIKGSGNVTSNFLFVPLENSKKIIEFKKFLNENDILYKDAYFKGLNLYKGVFKFGKISLNEKELEALIIHATIKKIKSTVMDVECMFFHKYLDQILFEKSEILNSFFNRYKIIKTEKSILLTIWALIKKMDETLKAADKISKNLKAGIKSFRKTRNPTSLTSHVYFNKRFIVKKISIYQHRVNLNDINRNNDFNNLYRVAKRKELSKKSNNYIYLMFGTLDEQLIYRTEQQDLILKIIQEIGIKNALSLFKKLSIERDLFEPFELNYMFKKDIENKKPLKIVKVKKF